MKKLISILLLVTILIMGIAANAAPPVQPRATCPDWGSHRYTTYKEVYLGHYEYGFCQLASHEKEGGWCMIYGNKYRYYQRCTCGIEGPGGILWRGLYHEWSADAGIPV